MDRLSQKNNLKCLDYLDKLRNEVALETNNPLNYDHCGRILIKALENDLTRINQIDGYEDKTETNASVLKRTKTLANALRKSGIGVGDVIMISGKMHLDICIPFYAGFYIGAPVMGIDRSYKLKELQDYLNIGRPKIIFCEAERFDITTEALKNIQLQAEIITFDKCEKCNDMKTFMEKGGDATHFRCSDVNGAEDIAVITTTSGSTGKAKAGAITHKCFLETAPYVWYGYSKMPTPIESALPLSPLQWLTAQFTFVYSAIYNYTRIQSSIDVVTAEHCYDLINKYRPEWSLLSPALVASMLRYPDHLRCNFSCFKKVIIAGSAVSKVLLDKMKEVTKGAVVLTSYGMTELSSYGFLNPNDQPPTACGAPLPMRQYKIVKENGDEVTEAYETGELWINGPCFKCYYNNPEETAAAFAPGGWLKTGDLFYKDENGYFYFVDRIKFLMKYKSHQISPTELEGVIRTLPEVLDVAVTSLTDTACGDLPVACVVPQPNIKITVEQVKNVVKDNLSDAKQLRGGVLFMDHLPQLSSTKIDRAALKRIAYERLHQK